MHASEQLYAEVVFVISFQTHPWIAGQASYDDETSSTEVQNPVKLVGVGACEGWLLGISLGSIDGAVVGNLDGLLLGSIVGISDGRDVG